jgi:hypothetical protein
MFEYVLAVKPLTLNMNVRSLRIDRDLIDPARTD